MTWIEGTRRKKPLKISNKSLWRTPERINQTLKTPQNYVPLHGQVAAVAKYANTRKLISQR